MVLIFLLILSSKIAEMSLGYSEKIFFDIAVLYFGQESLYT